MSYDDEDDNLFSPERLAYEEKRIRAARKTATTYRARLRKAVAAAAPIMSHWGDGNCGDMIETLIEELRAVGAYREDSAPGKVKPKGFISRRLSRAVFERDAYRCVMCSSHVDLSCDHIISEHDGGPTTLENLQTMCRSCNSSKGKKSFSVLREKAA